MSESPHQTDHDPFAVDAAPTVPNGHAPARHAGAVGADGFFPRDGVAQDDLGDDVPAGPDRYLVAADGPVDEIDLATDPFGDDLSERLRARAPLPITRTTVSLAGLVLVVAGFLGGVLVEKNFGSTARTAASGALPAGFAGRGLATPGALAQGGNGAGGQGGNGAGRGNPTTGTVKFVDGTTIYLTTAAGDVVTVKTSATTVVHSEQTTAVKDIAVGATVTVVGTADSDGIVTASQVTAQR